MCNTTLPQGGIFKEFQLGVALSVLFGCVHASEGFGFAMIVVEFFVTNFVLQHFVSVFVSLGSSLNEMIESLIVLLLGATFRMALECVF